MPDSPDKRSYNPNDLYPTPEFPEDEGTGVVYGTRKSHAIKPVFIWVPAALLLVVVAVLALTGVIHIPMPDLLHGGLPAATGQAIPPQGMPVVTEIMTDNQSVLASKNGKYYDWIELYNPTEAAVSLAGFGLSDSLKKQNKLVFPNISLPPHGFAIVFASGNTSSDGELHAPFKLSSSDKIVLTDPNGSPVQVINIPKLKTDESYAIDWSGMSAWKIRKTPTPGKPN